MRIIPLDAEATNNSYKKLYDQTGHGMIPIFTGEKYQTGYGLGSIFGSLLKAALPVVKEGVKSLGKTAVRTGLNIAKDKLAGKSLKDSFSDNVNQAKREVLTNSFNYVTNANQNKKRKQPSKKNTSSKASKRKRRKVSRKDIFSN